MGSTITNSSSSNDAEIIDLSSAESNCPNLTSYSVATKGAFGALLLSKTPIICSLEGCHTFTNNSWSSNYPMKRARIYSSSAMAPYPFDVGVDVGSVVVSGGQSGCENKNF